MRTATPIELLDSTRSSAPPLVHRGLHVLWHQQRGKFDEFTVVNPLIELVPGAVAGGVIAAVLGKNGPQD